MNDHPMLTITDTITSFCVTREEAIALELKLNVTRYRKIWVAIGDILYAFGTGRYAKNTINVTTEQYQFLEILHSRSSWKVCYDL